uniref:Uncharacterized protein n=1 Tax=Myoviridae sp. ctkfK18 TaxID=2825165 RepID=A0A8S5VGX3_9CAUD|nr:MAG TPA: hypothetical protein [Myoviridae sp. ctkfK18]
MTFGNFIRVIINIYLYVCESSGPAPRPAGRSDYILDY